MVDKENAKNCWEFMECPKELQEKCPAYVYEMGNECWFLAKLEDGCPRYKTGEGCIDCPWFLKKGQDIINNLKIKRKSGKENM